MKIAIEKSFAEWISSEDNPIRTMTGTEHPLPVTFEAGWRAALRQPEPLSDEQMQDAKRYALLRDWGVSFLCDAGIGQNLCEGSLDDFLDRTILVTQKEKP